MKTKQEQAIAAFIGSLHYEGVIQGARSKPRPGWTKQDAIEGAYDGPAYTLLLNLLKHKQ